MTGDIRLVAAREIRERTRGRIFRVGTFVMLAAVGAAIIIPVLRSSTTGVHRIGVVGDLPGPYRDAIGSAGTANDVRVDLLDEKTLHDADLDLRAGRIDLAVVGTRQILVAKAIAPGDTSVTAELVRTLTSAMGLVSAIEDGHLTPRQAALVARPPQPSVTSLQPNGTSTTAKVNGTTILALILVFILLSQYGTWTLMGVVEEKASRVVEVLLSAIKPIQLLAGKVLGIGVVALAQAGALLVFAIVLAKAVGSDLLAGTAPLDLVTSLAWLVLGYSFYCWVYAAAGSLAERQDQVQSLGFPLAIPLIVGYVTSITAAATGSASTFVKVLAYLPPTAPFAMPVLVSLGAVTWWEFAGSAVLSIVGTVAVARLAALIYKRAIVRTGRGVKIREVLARSS